MPINEEEIRAELFLGIAFPNNWIDHEMIKKYHHFIPVTRLIRVETVELMNLWYSLGHHLLFGPCYTEFLLKYRPKKVNYETNLEMVLNAYACGFREVFDDYDGKFTVEQFGNYELPLDKLPQVTLEQSNSVPFMHLVKSLDECPEELEKYARRIVFEKYHADLKIRGMNGRFFFNAVDLVKYDPEVIKKLQVSLIILHADDPEDALFECLRIRYDNKENDIVRIKGHDTQEFRIKLFQNFKKKISFSGNETLSKINYNVLNYSRFVQTYSYYTDEELADNRIVASRFLNFGEKRIECLNEKVAFNVFDLIRDPELFEELWQRKRITCIVQKMNHSSSMVIMKMFLWKHDGTRIRDTLTCITLTRIINQSYLYGYRKELDTLFDKRTLLGIFKSPLILQRTAMNEYRKAKVFTDVLIFV